MSYDFPLVCFTVFSQLAVGISIFLCWNMFAGRETDQGSVTKAWVWTFCFGAFALLASLFHLGHPFEAYKALFNLGDSWLSLEGLLFACFCALALIMTFWHSRFIALVTALCGCAGLVAQGLTYAPPSMPAINNVFPLALFVFSAFAMGACCERIMSSEKENYFARPCIVTVTVILLLAPAMWAAGTETMRASCLLWISSPFFWLGIVLLLCAFWTSYWPKSGALWQTISLVFGLFLTRMVFFADTVHTASNIGLPYN